MHLIKQSLVETASSLKTDSIDVIDYVLDVCERVKRIDSVVHSLVEEENLGTRLLSEATVMKQSYPVAESRPALYGVVVGIKDLYHVDGFPTQAGSKLPSALLQGFRSSLVTRIRDLGALILGKTAMDEFAYAAPSPTRNPHNLLHTPGGSSSGSAAAVATGISPLSIGTQTSRSVIAPASFCGVVGFKPTHGRVSLDGIVLMSQSLDTVGFFTQDVASMNMASGLLVPNWRPSTRSKRPVLGIPEGTFMTFMGEAMNNAFYERVKQLKQSGYSVWPVQMPWDNAIENIYTTAMKLLHGEMYRVHEVWITEHRSLYRDITIQGIERGKQVTDEELDTCRRSQKTLRSDLTTWMDEYGIDIWITPSQGATAPKGDYPTGWGGMTVPWSFAGMPCISIPAGTLDNLNLPYGIQAIGRYNDDESLIQWACDLERCFQS